MKKKVELKNLKVTSFVTEIENSKIINGGGISQPAICGPTGLIMEDCNWTYNHIFCCTDTTPK